MEPRDTASRDQRPAGAFSDPDLLRRIASALVMVPLAIAAAWWGGWPFALFWLVAAAVVLWEWNRLILDEVPPVMMGGELMALAAAVLLIRYFLNPGFGLVALGIGAGIALAFSPQGRSRWAIGGLLYATAVVAGPVILRDDPSLGFIAILWLFAVVWGADVAAYFAGRTIGGPKLWPALSPKKTWSGFIGGLVAGTSLGLAVVHLSGVPVSFGLALCSAAIAAASQGGDLFESFVKRRFSAKDAGKLIPGHGGVMDRLDGFLVAAIVAALVGLARGGLGAPAQGILVW
ncbi:phosphatidate cytidylyltransferase [Phreatobacter sp.]|uniref:phosphatidate cytidylyltransferase n=1 Tax=Phreatobacter sp. TaxID=1966341 RepID=UPI003F721150